MKFRLFLVVCEESKRKAFRENLNHSKGRYSSTLLHLKQKNKQKDYKIKIRNGYKASSVHNSINAGKSVIINFPRVVEIIPLLRNSVSSRVI